VYYVRTGSFLDRPKYAVQRFYPETRIGCPIATIKNRKIEGISFYIHEPENVESIL